MAHWTVFPDAPDGMLREMGFTASGRHVLHIGGQKRHGSVDPQVWNGIDVRLTPVAAFRDKRRAQFFADHSADAHPDITGRRFIRPMADKDGRMVYVVMFERYV